MCLMEAENLSVQYGEKTVLKGISLTLAEGQWLMLTGPNGAGKSTTIRALTGGVLFTGDVSCLGKNIREWKRAAFARTVGVMAQNHSMDYAFRTEEVVRMGRYAWRRRWGASDPGGEEKVETALQAAGLSDLRERSVLTLSGGELQRVFLAQVFAQDPRILILDEPTSHLDLIYQKQTFSLIEKWLAEKGRAVLSVVHDLSLAKAFGTHALLLKNGETVSYGQIDEALSGEHLHEAYGMDVRGWMRKLMKEWE